jgi:bifunctional DNA-binding transcriptional regulator/antitoxin component of YhaV-PrlF toxin-antitoxin module
MGKVTSKLQVTVPKTIAEQYRIRPGDEIVWVPAGDAIRVQTRKKVAGSKHSAASRLRLFDGATERQRGRNAQTTPAPKAGARGWTREELYGRGRPR